MNSPNESKAIDVSLWTLSLIEESAKRAGYPAALHEHLDLPSFPYQALRERAIHHFVFLPSASFDQGFVPRCWIKAYEDLMGWSGIHIKFQFPHIDPYVVYGHDLPELPDNPS